MRLTNTAAATPEDNASTAESPRSLNNSVSVSESPRSEDYNVGSIQYLFAVYFALLASLQLEDGSDGK